MERKIRYRDLPEEEKQIYWQKLWQNGDTEFHLFQAHPDLVKYEDKLLKEKCRVFLPLCGKAVDLKYLAAKGHEVVGNEYCEEAILQFFDDQGIEYEKRQHPTAPYEIFRATGKKITIYKGDFFGLNSSIVGKFDAIWDRGSFVAIDPSCRQQYADIIYDIMNTDGKYLLYSVEYEGEISTSPYNVTAQDLDVIYGKNFDFSVLETYETAYFNFVHLPVAVVSLIFLKSKK
ncbi:putative thiopurine S-methyltransferase [Clavelina lepadiformis]|uniref:putative thiopurine S-methyltransferase n=1 Tax=Clavelina lepadiformis TaxID=159417 RepID=UPI004043004C